MTKTTYRPIHEDEDLIVFRKATASDVAIFAFNNWGTIYPTPQVWGTDFIDRSGFGAVVFMAKKRNWFPAGAMAPAIAAVRREVGKPAFSFTFGNSMGGYAALKYQRALKARACLAFNPQYTLDPAGSPFDDRFRAHWTPEMVGMDVVPEDVDRDAFVFHDPGNPQDSGHARILADMPGVQGIPVFHTGHVTVRSVVRGSTIPELVDLIREKPGGAAPEVRRLLRRRKKSSFDYYQTLAEQLLARNHRRMFVLLLDFMEREAGLKPQNLETIRQMVAEAPPPPVGEREPDPPAPSSIPAPLVTRGLPRFAGAAAPAGGWVDRLWSSFGRKGRQPR